MTALRFKKVSVLLFLCAVFGGVSLFAVTLPVFAEKAPKKSMKDIQGKVVGIKAKSIRNSIEDAKEAADRAAEATSEKFQKNNYTMAVDRLRGITKSIADLEEIAGPNDPEIAALKQEYEEAKKYVYQVCAPLREKFLADVKAPQDVYKGADKAKFKDMIMGAWKKAYPNDEILAIRFHSANWQNTKTKRWNDAVNEWQYNDVSALVASVIVKNEDGKTATIFAAFINKDNQDGSIDAGVHTKYGEYVVKEMLLSNFK